MILFLFWCSLEKIFQFLTKLSKKYVRPIKLEITSTRVNMPNAWAEVSICLSAHAFEYCGPTLTVEIYGACLLVSNCISYRVIPFSFLFIVNMTICMIPGSDTLWSIYSQLCILHSDKKLIIFPAPTPKLCCHPAAQFEVYPSNIGLAHAKKA